MLEMILVSIQVALLTIVVYCAIVGFVFLIVYIKRLYCQFDVVCPYSGTCSACLFGIASNFIGCPEKPLTNFSRVSDRENNEKAYMDKIRLDKGIEGGL